MRPRVRTFEATTAGSSAWIAWNRRKGRKSVHVTLSAGANLTWSLEHTLSNLQDGSTPAIIVETSGNTGALAWSDDRLLSGSRVTVVGAVTTAGTFTITYLDER